VLKHREEVIQAFRDLEIEEGERAIRASYGNKLAKVEIEVRVTWFDSIVTGHRAEEIVAGDTPEDVVSAVCESYRELSSPNIVLGELTGALGKGVSESMGEETHDGEESEYEPGSPEAEDGEDDTVDLQ
jgi:hypothetical protein